MKFYVFDIFDQAGEVIYVGKGSGRRMHVSMVVRGGSSCREFAFFDNEKDAYQFERERIAALRPRCNKAHGGAGGKSGLCGAHIERWSADAVRGLAWAARMQGKVLNVAGYAIEITSELVQQWIRSFIAAVGREPAQRALARHGVELAVTCGRC